jgi:hypothetical protein
MQVFGFLRERISNVRFREYIRRFFALNNRDLHKTE